MKISSKGSRRGHFDPKHVLFAYQSIINMVHTLYLILCYACSVNSHSPILFDSPQRPRWVLSHLYHLIARWFRSISFESITPLSYALRFSVMDLRFLEERTFIFFDFVERVGTVSIL
jgi:hypothetical protein